ncbi:MAG: TROVE domain-containing protein [Ginsengibacter sp.]
MRFNFLKNRQQAVPVNYEGANTFKLTPELELYTAVATASLTPNFYENADAVLQRIWELIAKTDVKFVAKLAVYAKEEMYLRSVPIVLAVELAKQHSGDGLVSALTARIVKRADEITELLAYYAKANNRGNIKQLNKLSKQLQKGLAGAFNRFDEYQFAKYNRDTVVKLKDALFLVHPKAKNEAQQNLFNKIVKDKLETPYTWEVELSALGLQKYDSAELKKQTVKEKWEELIFSNKIGYMALLRNLRNILLAEVSYEAITEVCNYLTNANAVARSRQLPFRFLSAYRELKELKNGNTGMVLNALEEAVLPTTGNIAGYDSNTKVVIAADVSGSMQTALSARSKVQRFDIGLVLAMLLQSRYANVMTGMFGDTWKVINVPKKNILASVMEFHRREGEVGYSTNGYLVVEDLLNRGKVVDKIMMFTDAQLWNGKGNFHFSNLWTQYKQTAPEAKLYLFDLAGYGNMPLNVLKDDVYVIAGWSDKIFDVLDAIDNGSDALKMINAIAL